MEPFKCESAIGASGNHLRSDRRWDDDHGASLKLVGIGSSVGVRATAVDTWGGGASGNNRSGGVSSDGSGAGEGVGGKNNRGDGRRVVADEHHELVVESGGVAQVSWVKGGCVTDADVVGFGVKSEGEDGGGASSEVRDRLANIVAVSSAVAIREVGDIRVGRIGRRSETGVPKWSKEEGRGHGGV